MAAEDTGASGGAEALALTGVDVRVPLGIGLRPGPDGRRHGRRGPAPTVARRRPWHDPRTTTRHPDPATTGPPGRDRSRPRPGRALPEHRHTGGAGVGLQVGAQAARRSFPTPDPPRRPFLMPFVFDFDHSHRKPPMEMKDLLGGKGANLAEMTSVLALPVPPASPSPPRPAGPTWRSGWPEGLTAEIARARTPAGEEDGQAHRRRGRSRCWCRCARGRSSRCPA